MPRTARNLERINLRVSPRSKSKLERAAAYSEKTLTDFVVGVALQEADAIVRRHEVIALSDRDWIKVQKMLLNPPAPNKRLMRAFANLARVRAS